MSSARIRGSDYGRLTSRRRTNCLRFLAYFATPGAVLISSLFVLHFALGPDQLAISKQAALEITLLKSNTTGSLAAKPPSEPALAEESTVQPMPEEQASEQKRRSRTKTSKTGSASRSSDSRSPQFQAADYVAAQGTLGPH